MPQFVRGEGYSSSAPSFGHLDHLNVGRLQLMELVLTKASLVVDDLGVISAALGEGLGRSMAIYREEIAVVA